MSKPNEYKFDLGTELTDVVTNLTGIVIGRTQWLTGCNSYQLQLPAKTGEDKDKNQVSFDENRLRATGVTITLPTDKEKEEKPKDRERGGPTDKVKPSNSLR